MSRAVWKYPLPLPSGHAFTLNVPDGRFEPLFLCSQPHVGPCLWAEVEPDTPAVAHPLVWVPTGAAVPPTGHYLGTLLFHGGTLVYHLYALTADPF